MDRNLFAALVRRRIGRRVPRLPKLLQPDALRLQFFAALRNGLIRDMREAFAKHAPALRFMAERRHEARGHKMDAGDDLGSVIDAVERALAEKWSRKKIADVSGAIGFDTAKFHAGQMNKQLYELAGVDVVGNEPWLRGVVEAFTRENVALIKSLPVETFGRIEKMLTGRIADGDRWESMAEEIEAAFGVSESRAKLIARDQVGKLYGDLNRVRQTDLGFEGYFWRTMNDNRVRDEHEEFNGRRFLWSEPPAGGPGVGGHPGEAIMCRCYAEPDLKGLLESEGVSTEGIDFDPKGYSPPDPKPTETAPAEKAPKPPPAPVDPGPVTVVPSEPPEPLESTRVADALAFERKSQEIADRLIDMQRNRARELHAQVEQWNAKHAEAERARKEAADKVDALRVREQELIRRVEEAETKHGIRSEEARQAANELAKFSDQDLYPARKAVRQADEALSNAAYERTRTERDLQQEITNPNGGAARAAEYDAIKKEGQGPVRGPASEEIAREYPELARILGGRLKVEGPLNEGTRQLLDELNALPPSFLGALKPHMGEISINTGTIKGKARFTDLTHKQARDYDSRSSWDQAGGVATPTAGVGRLEVLVPDWKENNKGVMAHELSHILDGVLGGDVACMSNTMPSFRKAWRAFAEGKATNELADGLTLRPRLQSHTYFTNLEVGPIETFAEAHATYLNGGTLPASKEALDSFKERHGGGKSDEWLRTAYHFGPGIADIVDDRVKNERWLIP